MRKLPAVLATVCSALAVLLAVCSSQAVSSALARSPDNSSAVRGSVYANGIFFRSEWNTSFYIHPVGTRRAT